MQDVWVKTYFLGRLTLRIVKKLGECPFMDVALISHNTGYSTTWLSEPLLSHKEKSP